MNMHADEKSDEVIVPEKQPNKGSLLPAEAVEGRTSPKGNGGQTAAVPELGVFQTYPRQDRSCMPTQRCRCALRNRSELGGMRFF